MPDSPLSPGLTLAERVKAAVAIAAAVLPALLTSGLYVGTEAQEAAARESMLMVDALEAEARKREPKPYVPMTTIPIDERLSFRAPPPSSES